MNLVNEYMSGIKTQDIPIGTKLIITKVRNSGDIIVGDIITVVKKEPCRSEYCPQCIPKYSIYFTCDRTKDKIQHTSCNYRFKTMNGREVV